MGGRGGGVEVGSMVAWRRRGEVDGSCGGKLGNRLAVQGRLDRGWEGRRRRWGRDLCARPNKKKENVLETHGLDRGR